MQGTPRKRAVIDRALNIGVSICIIALMIGYVMMSMRGAWLKGRVSELKKKLKAERQLNAKDRPFRYNFLVLGVDEKGRCDYRGHNDVSILFCIEDDKVRAISFPRDMIVKIPEKGWWMICNVFPYLSGPGAARWFEDYFRVRIDHYIVFDIHAARKTVRRIGRLPGIPKYIKAFVKDYNYIEDWVRHRHKLKLEIARQKRIQAFLDRAHRLSARHRGDLFGDFSLEMRDGSEPYRGQAYRGFGAEERAKKLETWLIDRICEAVIPRATVTDMDAKDLRFVCDLIMSRESIKWYIWPGIYAPRNFDYPIFKGMRYCWVSETKTVSDVFEYNPMTVNPFVYSRTNFFAVKADIPDKYYVTTKRPKWKYKRWIHIDREDCQ